MTVTILPLVILVLLLWFGFRTLGSLTHISYAFMLTFLGMPAPAAACVVGTEKVLARLPEKDEPHPFFFR